MTTTSRRRKASPACTNEIERAVSVPTIHWDNGWHNITDDHKRQWRKAFPKVKIDAELEVMNQWLWANPSRRKKNYPRFIISWLKREQEVALVRPTRTEPAVHCSGKHEPPPPKTKEEIDKAVQENRESGKSKMVADALKQLRSGRLEGLTLEEARKHCQDPEGGERT